jgi:hypothetical protein
MHQSTVNLIAIVDSAALVDVPLSLALFLDPFPKQNTTRTHAELFSRETFRAPPARPARIPREIQFALSIQLCAERATG